jgi:thioredoxin-related protein
MMNEDADIQTAATNDNTTPQRPSATSRPPAGPRNTANRRFLGFALFVLLAMAVIMIWQSVSPAHSAVAWQTDLDAAIQEARQLHKPVLVSFTSPACTYCRQMETEVLPQPAVLAEIDKFIPVKVNAFVDTKTSTRYGVDALPAYVVLDSHGEVLGMIDGYRPASAFIRFLQYAASAAGKA